MKLFKITFVFYFFVLFMSGCDSNKSAPENSRFSILDYGAVGDGATMNTKAIQTTIDACADAGGGRIIIPKGSFLTGTIILKSNVEIHLKRNATLLGSIHQSDYPAQAVPKYRALRDEVGFNSLIYAEGAENIAITGMGTIDGQGQLQRRLDDIPEGEKDDRPKVIMFVSCKNLVVEDVHLQNSGFWMQHYLNCEDVRVTGISVFNHSNNNNDGIDIDGCRRVIISGCSFDSVDDAITLKSTGMAMCEDVTITNCIASSNTNAIKAGTESSGGFKNINISNCIVKPSRYTGKSVYHEDDPGSGYTAISLIIMDGGVIDGININNITIEGTHAPLYIRLGNRARKHKADAPEPKVGSIQNISISNLIAHSTGVSTSSIEGMVGYSIKNISFSNIQLLSVGGVTEGNYVTDIEEDDTRYPEPHYFAKPASGLYLRHVEGITINGLVVGVEEKDERPPIWVEDVSQLLVTNSRIFGPVKLKTFVGGTDLTDYKIEKPLGWKGKLIKLK